MELKMTILKNKWIPFVVIFCLLIPVSLPGKSNLNVPLPTGDFFLNFCNFPKAWAVSRGKNVNIGILFNESTKKENVSAGIKRVLRYAPEAVVEKKLIDGFYVFERALEKYHILLPVGFVEPEYPRVIKAVKHFTGKGCAVILPAYDGPMKKEMDYSKRKAFIIEASKAGAIIVGAHGRFYQPGDLSAWKNLPIDTYAVQKGLDGDSYFKPGSLLDRDISQTAYMAAGVAALLKSSAPMLSPSRLKELIRTRGRKVFWALVESITPDGKTRKQIWAKFNKPSMLAFLERLDFKKNTFIESVEGSCLDAGLILGLPPMKSGQWTRSILEISEAQKMATGKGVTVAILDHMFDNESPFLNKRIVKPGSMIEGKPTFSVSGHGTQMAEEVVKIAPDVRIMPIRICCSDTIPYTDLYIKGIEYAVKNGADIISLSHRAVPKDRRDDLDRAIASASQKGITCVFIHYKGKRNDVVVPGPIEFALYDHGIEMVYVVGTNFINESSFPYTWGVSPTAPIVAGIVAMLKELNPKLSPLEINSILKQSFSITVDDYPLLNAWKAVATVKQTR
jgi:hypothetical protein